MTAKTTISEDPKPFTSPITYVFKNVDGKVISIDGWNYPDAKRKLNQQTGNKKGFKLKERRP